MISSLLGWLVFLLFVSISLALFLLEKETWRIAYRPVFLRGNMAGDTREMAKKQYWISGTRSRNVEILSVLGGLEKICAVHCSSYASYFFFLNLSNGNN